MKNSKNTPKKSQKISNPEEFTKAFKKELEKRGMSDLLKETPSQPTNEYTVVLRPFAKRKKNKN